MLLTELLAMPGLGLTPLLPTGPRDRRVTGVYTTDLPDPGRYLDGGELVLTSTTWYREPRDADVFVAALASAGAAALVAGSAAVRVLPGALADACERHGLPLLAVGDDVSYAALTETVLAALAGPVGRSPGAGLHRGLVASMASGAGAEGLVEVLARSTGVHCAVLSATGRPTAGAVPTVSGHHLRRSLRAAFAAGAFPSVQPLPGGGHLTFLPVQSPVAHRPPAGYLAAAGDHRDWAPGIADAAEEVCALLALEGVGRQERRRIEERLLRESVELLREGRTEPAAGRLRSLGLDLDAPLAVGYVTTTGRPYGAELAAVVLEDVYEQIPGCSAPFTAPDGHLMFVPAADGDPSLCERLTEAARRLDPFLAHGWAAIGVSGPATGQEGLRRMLEEARQAQRVARLGTGAVRTAGPEALSSHLMLLAAVPDEVRLLYRERLIGVLERYDAEHHSDLVGTLSAFLDASGSWQRCARQLHIHVNTLRYRLRRVEQLTGHSLATLHDRVDFCLALGIR
ncbi:PucR family transcriptional regulator ligand-binding domain-containing protein [Streptomyces sp. NBC_01185]|uniref:helix-turn-helix domain-containing protein n=1 Tax=Streptomyces sp. NBC_01185 TaxID=2903764 RepID=UPI00386FD1DE|nr:PucR family transcriptional regulator ligand-binding domain-containing protein [Streptomyces sp. NBC_01185]